MPELVAGSRKTPAIDRPKITATTRSQIRMPTTAAARNATRLAPAALPPPGVRRLLRVVVDRRHAEPDEGDQRQQPGDEERSDPRAGRAVAAIERLPLGCWYGGEPSHDVGDAQAKPRAALDSCPCRTSQPPRAGRNRPARLLSNTSERSLHIGSFDRGCDRGGRVGSSGTSDRLVGRRGA